MSENSEFITPINASSGANINVSVCNVPMSSHTLYRSGRNIVISGSKKRPWIPTLILNPQMTLLSSQTDLFTSALPKTLALSLRLRSPAGLGNATCFGAKRNRSKKTLHLKKTLRGLLKTIPTVPLRSRSCEKWTFANPVVPRCVLLCRVQIIHA